MQSEKDQTLSVKFFITVRGCLLDYLTKLFNYVLGNWHITFALIILRPYSLIKLNQHKICHKMVYSMTMFWFFLILLITAKTSHYRFRSPAQLPEQPRLGFTPIFYCNMSCVSWANVHTFLTRKSYFILKMTKSS